MAEHVASNEQNPELACFERDPDQKSTPVGYTKYIFRAPRQVFNGVVIKGKLGSNGLPHFTYDTADTINGESGARRPEYPGEPSHLLVKEGAEIDPAVFALKAPPPWPKDWN